MYPRRHSSFVISTRVTRLQLVETGPTSMPTLDSVEGFCYGQDTLPSGFGATANRTELPTASDFAVPGALRFVRSQHGNGQEVHRDEHGRFLRYPDTEEYQLLSDTDFGILNYVIVGIVFRYILFAFVNNNLKCIFGSRSNRDVFKFNLLVKSPDSFIILDSCN